MLQYSVEPTSYLHILTIKTHCVESRQYVGEDAVSIALELERLSYQSVDPVDKLKLLTAIHSRCVGLKEILETLAANDEAMPHYWMVRNLLEGLINTAAPEISRLTTKASE